ncbi:hypothetical protein [Tautonia sociabilis]|uniref:Class I SAM-dependent methyltransferase n=1 Tax=Tautonia sociabilis TaxID=2080755 RepID=A0A432MDN3_9BACT|nr:hypothetical protein [Tautonia sociabilis]RUL82948.1 hypothetical protein TsocGM_22890 [Tautonia sociabilis]
MDDLRSRQAAFNASSRSQWEGFAGHRRRVSALLGAGEGQGGGQGASRLCVLGVGNANDLDLPALLARHREVHLVDLDAGALAGAAERQGVAGRPGLILHGGLDVSAMLDAISGWSPFAEVGPADLRALAEWPAGRVPMVLPGPFDRVASTCLLSQLVETASHALGDRHPRFGAVAEAIRDGHLRLLARLTAPGGEATLITDVVSTRNLPALSGLPEEEFPELLPMLARTRNHMHGLHPAELRGRLRDDPVLSSKVTGVRPARPWAWRLHDRTYLVWALSFRVGGGRSP